MEIKKLKMKISVFILLFSIFQITATTVHSKTNLMNVSVNSSLNEISIDEKQNLITENSPKNVTQTVTITGVVSDASGNPLPGVSIMIVGTTKGTDTDFDGNYTLEAKKGDVLQFSYMGMKTKKVTVGNSNTINVSLDDDSSALEEVVIVGYGTQKKVNLTGAVSTVSAEQIESRPVSNVMNAIQGAVPNMLLSVGNSGGEPGANMAISIRGVGSLSGNDSPYVIVDGMPLDNPNEINNINPEDIANISVLKDAASTAIYGSKAAFGVILITTKSGSASDGVNVTYSNNFIFASPLKLPEMMNSVDFANFFNLSATNGGSGKVFSDEVMARIIAYAEDPVNNPNTVPNASGDRYQQYTGSNANTDWFDAMYKDVVARQQHNISLSGKQNKVKYFLSGSFFDQDGIMEYGDDEYQRYTLNSKIDTEVNDWFSMNANIRLSKTSIERPSYDRGLYLHNIARRWPVNGIIMPNGSYSDGSEIPFVMDGGRYNNDNETTNTNLNFIFEPIKDLKVTATLLYRNTQYIYNNHNAKVSTTGPAGNEIINRAWNDVSKYASKSTYLSPNLVISYNKSLNNETHNFSGVVGFQQEEDKYTNLWGKRNDLITDNVPSISTAVGDDQTDDGVGHYATRGYFGRLSYDYQGKYLIEFNGRYDASSKFARDDRWAFFPSVSAGYNLAKEDFWNVDQIGMLKLRFSYGNLGNQNVSNYLYVPRMPVNTNLWWVTDYGRPNYTTTPGLISSDITWEKVSTTNFGVDVSAMNSRLSASLDVFTRQTEDMFGPAEKYPGLLGTGAPLSNNASLETKGFGLVVKWNDEINDFKYGASFNISNAKTTVLEYKNPNNLLNTYREGQTIGEIWGFETVGLYQSQEEIDNGADQSTMYGGVWFPGDVQYKDLNDDGHIDWGDSTTDNPGDRKIIGNSTPQYQFGLNMNASYKGIDLSMIWQGIGKRDLYIGGPYMFGVQGNLWQSAGFVDHLDYWSETNTDAYYARPSFRSSWRNQETQTRYLQNAAYLRLKNISLGYTFPKTILETLNLSKLRVFVSGENVLTFTKMADMFDPETTGGYWGSGKIYPLQKVLAIGMNVQF